MGSRSRRAPIERREMTAAAERARPARRVCGRCLTTGADYEMAFVGDLGAVAHWSCLAREHRLATAEVAAASGLA